MIRFEKVSKRYKNLVLFEDVSLEIPTGKIVGLIGENGSGKSVLMKLICGYSKPNKGSIEVFDQILGKERDFPNNAGILINDPNFIKTFTGMENLNMLIQIRKKTDRSYLDSLICAFGMEPNIHKLYKTYSLGMKQKLRIIQAFMEQPDLLILDEPFNALDKESNCVLSDMIKSYINDHRIIILTSHERHNIDSLADTVLCIEEKNLVVKNSKSEIA